MTELEFRFEAELRLSEAVTEHVFALHCLPVEDETQQLRSYQVELTPAAGYGLQRDGFGSWLVCGAVREAHAAFSYASHGIVRVDQSRRRLCSADPVLRYPTPLTAPDDAIRALWASLPLAGQSRRRQAELLNQAAAQALAYAPGMTGTATTASEALALGKGVCQDKAHLLLALARLSGFAGRYCMGLIPGEGATHAWAELALPEGWVGYDPTHCRETGEQAVRFAIGRDAADCPAEKGIWKGCAAQTLAVRMKLWERVGV